MSDLPPPPSVPAPPAFPRPDWRAAVFNYGSLVAAVLGVLGFLFLQMMEVREKLAAQSERLTSLTERIGALEKTVDRRFDETRQDLAAIRALLEKRAE